MSRRLPVRGRAVRWKGAVTACRQFGAPGRYAVILAKLYPFLSEPRVRRKIFAGDHFPPVQGLGAGSDMRRPKRNARDGV
jgi:hypothetical protein